jgi:uncharacterized protein YraI
VFTTTADDSIRVTVDGVAIVDEPTRVGDIQTYTAETVLTGGGQHLIVIEYVDRGGTSVIQFQWQLAGDVGPSPTPGPTLTPTDTLLPPIPPGAITATVIRAGALNVRSGPSLGAPRLGLILRGQTYAIVGRDSDARWFLLQLSDKQAWAYGYYLHIEGNEFNPPIVSAAGGFLPPGVVDTGVLAQARAVMKLRAEPNTWSEQIGRITWGGFVPVVGRTSDGSWWQVVWKGTVGWVFSPFLRVTDGDFNNVPVVP